MEKRNKKPYPGALLYDELFAKRTRWGTLCLLSEGLYAIAQNASELLGDAKLLFDAKRFARADFLIATADEEMAKSYIILDMCRLDFDKYQSLLNVLCKAFYSHIQKYAYNQIARFPRNFHDMMDVQEIYKHNIKNWFPTYDIEAGEPDMPHHTVFTRDFNLYVDYIGYDEKWHIPSGKSNMVFDLVKYNLSDAHEALKKLIFTRDEGLYKPEALDILNESFKKHPISIRTNREQLLRLYDTVAESIEKELGITTAIFKESVLVEWPLYHFLSNKNK